MLLSLLLPRIAAATAALCRRRCCPTPPSLLPRAAVAAAAPRRHHCYPEPPSLLPRAAITAAAPHRHCCRCCPALLPRTAAVAAAVLCHPMLLVVVVGRGRCWSPLGLLLHLSLNELEQKKT